MRRSSAVARAVYKRDNGICQSCGLDCNRIKKLLSQKMDNEKRTAIWGELERHGFKKGYPLTEIHHIEPLAEGGPDTIENAELRCRVCHREATTEQAKRAAKRRKLIGRKAIETIHWLKLVQAKIELIDSDGSKPTGKECILYQR